MTCRRLCAACLVVLVTAVAESRVGDEAAKKPTENLSVTTQVVLPTTFHHPGGAWELEIGGVPVFCRLRMDAKGKLSGLATADGSDFVVKGKTKTGRRGQSVVLKGTSLANGKPDGKLKAKIAVAADGRLSGIGAVTRRSRPLVAKSKVFGQVPQIAGRIRRGLPESVVLRFDLAADAGNLGRIDGDAVARVANVGGVLLREAGASKVKVKAKAGKLGGDLVKILFRGSDLNLTFDGTHQGGVLSGEVWGRVLGIPVDRTPVNVATGERQSARGFRFGSGSGTLRTDSRGANRDDVAIDLGTGVRAVHPTGLQVTPLSGGPLLGDVDITWTGIPPRVGLSHQVGDKTLLKGGYALYADNLELGLAGTGNPAYVYTYVYGITDDLDGNGTIASDELFSMYAPYAAAGEGAEIDADLSSPKTNEIVIGASHQLTKDFVVSGSFPHRSVGEWKMPLKFGVGGALRAFSFGGLVAGDVPGNDTRSATVPGDDTSVFPRFLYFQLHTPGSALGIGAARDAEGLTLGESAIGLDLAGDPCFEVGLSGSGGERRLSSRSRYKNEFALRCAYIDDAQVEHTLDVLLPGGLPDEADLAGPYLGSIRLDYDGVRTAAELHRFLYDLGVSLPAAADIDHAGTFPRGNGVTTARIWISGYEMSVRSLATLIDGQHEFEYGNRTLRARRVHLPELVAVTALQRESLEILALDSLTSVASVGLPGRPTDVKCSADGSRAFVMAGGRLVSVDVENATIIGTAKVKGAGENIALDPLGDRVYTTNTQGEFMAYDAVTLRCLFRASGVGGAGLNGQISLDPGGSRAYFSTRAESGPSVQWVDLVTPRRPMDRAQLAQAVVDHPFALPAWDIDVSYDGVLGVSDINANLVRIADGSTGAVTRAVGVGQTPLQTRWSAEGDYVVTPAFNANALEIVDVAAGTVRTVGGIAGANGLDLYVDGDGHSVALVGAFNANQLFKVRLDTGAVVGTATPGFQPGPLDVPGR